MFTLGKRLTFIQFAQYCSIRSQGSVLIHTTQCSVYFSLIADRYHNDSGSSSSQITAEDFKKYEKDNKAICGHLLNHTYCKQMYFWRKFPPSWKYYRNHLKHRKRDMSLQELISHMRNEEANRLKDKLSTLPLNASKANLIESVSADKKNRFKGKEMKHKFNLYGKEGKKIGPSKSGEKFKKKQGQCYVCGKPGHKAYQCYQRKDQISKPSHAAHAYIAEQEDVIAAAIETCLVEYKTQ
ncbi:hypothetical protein E3N88_34948 [Mikania micrantha]|uniref:CCHC-type domain-containing protein n=1 Tax=Mikania micrantha TaxID=192012 RepID=A0A5N6LZQ5_9ASTR|nr:hypothetical protein E3N88_34948 [Mikania micrantha]